MKQIVALFCIFAALSVSAQLNLTYQGQVNYDLDLSDIWGYAAPNGDEYALVGVYNGVSIVDVTDPTNPTEVAFVDGVETIWRDIKTWGSYAYVTNEGGNGLEVIDLSDLPNSVSSFSWTPNLPGLGTLSTCHNIWIDENGYAYLTGCNVNSGGMLYIDVFSNPGNPFFEGAGPAVYSHDCYVRDNIAYSCEVYNGVFGVYDVTDKQNTILLGNQETTGGVTHNCWLNDAGDILFVTDETGNAPVGSYNVTDPTNIIHLDDFVPYETLGEGVIPHNVHVWNDWLIISYYTDGCILVDGSNPSNLIEVGNFDTYIPASTGFNGAWGAYPYLPSGVVLVSDIGNGLYILEPTYVNACWLEGTVTNASTTDPLSGAEVAILTTTTADQTNISGFYSTGYAVSGVYDVEVSKAGFISQTVQVELMNGETVELNVALEELPNFTLTGNVVDAVSGDAVPFAEVRVFNSDFDLQFTTDASGLFSLNTFYEGTYDVYGGKWGYRTVLIEDAGLTTGTPTLTIEVEEGYEDPFALDLGWSTQFNGWSGAWELGEPIGVFDDMFNAQIIPEYDVAEDIGDDCYITGNTSDVFSGVLVGGQARLSSPSMDLSGYDDPWISYYTWFWSIDTEFGNPADGEMVLTIDDGKANLGLDTVVFEAWETLDWQFRSVRILDFTTPNSDMSVSFVADTPGDFSVASDVVLDFFMISEGDPTIVDDKPRVEAGIQIYPNPTHSDFTLSYEATLFSSSAYAEVFDLSGKLVRRVALHEQQGQVRCGADLEAGVYVVRISDATLSSEGKLVVKR